MIGVFPQRLMALAFAAAPLFSATACSGPAHVSKGASAVRINEEEIPYSEFEGYLRVSFGEEVPPSDDSETRSRLFDQFIEERLLLQRALGERLRVADEEVDSYLAGLGSGSRAGVSGEDAAMKEQIRRSLLIREYKDRILLRDVKVDPSEAQAYFLEHPEEFQQSRVVVLRQILLESPAEAKRMEEALKEDPARFPILAQQVSLSPDKGQPRPFQEEELPESVRLAVLSLSPGQVSGPVEEGGKIRIFQMVDRREGRSQTLEEARGRIEVLILQRKAEETLSVALDGIRKSATIRVHRDKLPFSYQGEYGG